MVASITFSIIHSIPGKCLSIRGYDILHQMKQVQYAVNAQGRTQEMYNILPRFVMFSVQYTFDFKPKKHK